MQSNSSLTARTGIEPAEFAALRESVAGTLAKECDSLAVHAFIDGRSDLDRRLWKQAVALGWLALALPEAAGGLNLGATGIALICRELGSVAAPGAFIPTICGLQWLAEVGGDAAAPIIAAVLAGEHALAIPASQDAPVLRFNDGALSGTIDLLAGGDDPVAIVPTSVGWALVALGAATVGTRATWDRTRTVVSARFDGATPIAQVDDREAGERLGTLFAIALAADCVGASQAITDRTIAYLKERVQFERPIAAFQAIKHRAAELVTRIANHEAQLIQAVETYDGGSPDAAMWARLAKAAASEGAAFITGDCITLHGGVGHTWEYDPHIYAKRARLNQYLLADNGMLRSKAVTSLVAAFGEGRTTTEIAA